MRDIASSRFGRFLAVLLTLTTLAACQKWTTVESPIASTVEKNEPKHVRITTTDGRVIELDSPSVRGDSLTRGSNVGLTVLSIAGAAAIVVAIILATNAASEP
jgi:hypothetical protein